MTSDHQVTISAMPPIIFKQEEATSPDERDKVLEYQLNVEEHADKFFEMKHKITFFLITAAAVSIAYTLNFASSNLAWVAAFPERKACLIVAALGALVTVAFALLSMYYDVHINGLNLSAYFDRKLYEELPDKTKREWKATSKKAKMYEVLAFTCLGISIAYQAVWLMLFII